MTITPFSSAFQLPFGRAERDQRCRKIEAIRHYRTATHEDLSTAKAVVDAIQEEPPR